MNIRITKRLNKIILVLVLSLCSLHINAQGPNAPEAGAFEPVDATDMVTLLTGDFTYVLPLLNIPSPEGGYPLALSYHSGIGIDQEASWVGLGWNINPGAISRGVNGYPDDWTNGLILEHFFDVGGSDTTHRVTASYTSLYSGGWSVAGSLSYNSNRGFGGSVSFGYGVPVGGGYIGGGATLGVSPGGQFYGSLNAGYTFANGLTVGASVGTRGAGLNAGYSWSAGAEGSGIKGGVDVGLYHSYEGENALSVSFSHGEKMKKNSIGISLSSSGLSVATKLGGIGISQNFSFINSVSMSDYNVETDNDFYGMYFAYGESLFSLGYSKQTVRWHLNTRKTSNVSGALKLGDAIKYECLVTTHFDILYGGGTSYTSTVYVDSPSDCNCNNFPPIVEGWQCVGATLISEDPTNGGKYFMDINEIGTTEGYYKELNVNNAVFPAYDSYNVSAQGLSGSLTPKVSRTGALLGLSRNFEKTNYYKLTYNLTDNIDFENSFKNPHRVDFNFNNEYSSSFSVEPGNFTNNTSATKIYDYHQLGTGSTSTPRKKGGRFVSYYSLGEMQSGAATQDGLLLPINFSQIGLDPIGLAVPTPGGNLIGGYKITSPDGKTYHYSLPVFNTSTRVRTSGIIENKPERESYFETIQGSYATHWLLTAITGPDYINTSTDNRNYPDSGDLGYWVRFDYGKWTDIDVWKLPYAKEFEISEDNPNIKSKTHGIKQVYYLDRIKTRTHTALFVKNIREDNFSESWGYHAFRFGINIEPDPNYFDIPRFTIPSQKSLRLEKIILVKNEDDLVDRTSGSTLATPGMIFPSIFNEPKDDYNLQDNIIDIKDNITTTQEKAIKIIDFTPHYTYSLVNNSPNSATGRLTLNGITFGGKSGVQLVPSYKFQYASNPNFDYEKKDLWGFYKGNPKAWSLEKITMPTGSDIDITYESDDYSLIASKAGKVFDRHLKFTFFSDQLPSPFGPAENIQIKIETDDQDNLMETFQLSDYFDPGKPFYFDMWISAVFNGSAPGYNRSALDMLPQQAQIISLNANDNSMIVEVEAKSISYRDTFLDILNASPVSVVTGSNGFTENQKKSRYALAWKPNGDGRAYSLIHTIISNKRPDDKIGGGLRVKKLSVTDGISNYSTSYSYNTLNTDENPTDPNYISSGVISYLPFEEHSKQPIPYGSELLAPIPMYQYVTVKTNVGTNPTNDYLEKTRYKFKIMNEKEPDNIKFGDLLEISEETILNTFNSTQNKNVNIKKFELKDNLACIGQILEIERFNSKNQLLSKTINNYALANEITQGIVQESFETYKEVDYISSEITDDWFINSSKRIIYPSVLKSTTIIQNGYNSTTYFNKYDNISGQLLETSFKDSKSTTFKTKTVPAYTKYPQMGSKVDDNTNRNMLTQQAANYTYLIDESNNTEKLISAGITTWNNDWAYRDQTGVETSPTLDNEKNWRKHKTYLWKGDVDANDGTYIGFNQNNDDGFNWGLGYDVIQTNPKWKNVSTITRYDHYSTPLEVRDINNNYTSTKMGDNESKIIATANAKYTEVLYSGCEYVDNVYEGEIFHVGVNTVKTHTGKYSVKVIPGGSAITAFLKENEHRPGKYKISVWAHKDNYTNARLLILNNYTTETKEFNGEKVFAGDWVQLNHYEDFDSSQATVWVRTNSGEIYYDDFRIHPVFASMTSYVYNEGDELWYIIGTNGLATRFEYDATGRLEKTYTEIVDDDGVTGGFKKVSENRYNYKAQ